MSTTPLLSLKNKWKRGISKAMTFHDTDVRAYLAKRKIQAEHVQPALLLALSNRLKMEEEFRNELMTSDFSYTYIGTVTPDIFAFTPEVVPNDWRNFVNLQTGIAYKAHFNILNPLNKITAPEVRCNIEYETHTNTVFDRVLEPRGIMAAFSYCNENLYNQVFSEALKSGIDKTDVTGTIFAAILDVLIMTGLERDIARRVWFGTLDENASKDFRGTQGILTQIFANTGSEGGGCIRETSFASLDPDTIIQELRDQQKGASRVLRQNKRLATHFVTPNVFDTLDEAYQDKTLAGGGLVQRTEDGHTRLFLNGSEIVPFMDWEENLADTDNPLFGIQAISLYTVPSNLWVGVRNTSDLTRVDGWWDKKDDKMYFRHNSTLDANFAHCDFTDIKTL